MLNDPAHTVFLDHDLHGRGPRGGLDLTQVRAHPPDPTGPLVPHNNHPTPTIPTKNPTLKHQPTQNCATQVMRRDFTADEPGRKWCGDITYISTWAGFVYLATVLDCCTKKVVGYAMADHMRTSLVCEAIDMAAKRCPVEKGVTVFHSDRGSQYTSQRFLDHLKTYGIRPSVGRTGVCWDNAWAESFNATLKNERVHRMVYPTRQKAINDIASWIELRYNHVRLHSALGYRTPNKIEQEFLDLTKAA